VDIETGDLIKKIDTEVGSTTTPNGLGSPAAIDTNGDYMVDLIYAGDLRGNLWKFDVSASNTNSWGVAYKTGSTPKPLFVTGGGANQPITTRPVISTHPTKQAGYMVYFGTGKYLETGDNDPTGANTQAFYGIWDKNLSSHTTFTTGDLVHQYITNQYSADFNTDDADGENDVTHTVRDVSDYAVDYATKLGWYMELKPQKVSNVANTSNFGEKQVANALVRDGKVIFSTLVPSQNQCDFGGNSFIMELDFENGGQLSDPPFDANGDGELDSEDTYIGGIESDVGIVGTLNVLLDGEGKLRAFGSGSGGDIGDFTLNPGANAIGRQSWRQIK
jgi:type IV pilus assembly protein PilY1